MIYKFIWKILNKNRLKELNNYVDNLRRLSELYEKRYKEQLKYFDEPVFCFNCNKKFIPSKDYGYPPLGNGTVDIESRKTYYKYKLYNCEKCLQFINTLPSSIISEKEKISEKELT